MKENSNGFGENLKRTVKGVKEAVFRGKTTKDEEIEDPSLEKENVPEQPTDQELQELIESIELESEIIMEHNEEIQIANREQAEQETKPDVHMTAGEPLTTGESERYKEFRELLDKTSELEDSENTDNRLIRHQDDAMNEPEDNAEQKDEKIISLEKEIAELKEEKSKYLQLEKEVKELREEISMLKQGGTALNEEVAATAEASAQEAGQETTEAPSDASIPQQGTAEAKSDAPKAEDGFAALSKQIFQLEEEITRKFAQDESKDRIIDNLHRELQGFKDNQTKDMVKPIILDLILMVDRTNKLVSELESNEEEYPKKLMNAIKDSVQDIEDILYRQGIDSYHCEVETFDAKRQQIAKLVKVDDPAKDKMIAEVVGNGYIWDEKIIRPERVKVYTYVQPKTN